MAKEYPRFKFLPRLKSDYGYIPPGAPTEPSNPWLDPWVFHLIPTAKEIAKSGIFTPDEKLRGEVSKPEGIRNRGRKCDLDNLPGFVLKLAQALELFPKLRNKEEWQKILNKRIALILNEFDELIEIFERCRIEKRTLNDWRELKDDIVEEHEKTLPQMNSPFISEVVDRCLTIFKQHIVQAPGIDVVIAHRTSELLIYFNIKESSTNPSSILKRFHRKLK